MKYSLWMGFSFFLLLPMGTYLTSGAFCFAWGNTVAAYRIASALHLTVATAKKYLDSLSAKELVSEDGTPTLNCKGDKFFTLPNEIFLLNLPPSAFMVYAYLLLIEDRICRLLFKLTVEIGMMMHVLAAAF